MKKHMKKLNINVMLGLLAVLFISLGYLSMQGKEGMKGRKDKEGMKDKKSKEGMKDKKK
jgi:hypothetical protein